MKTLSIIAGAMVACLLAGCASTTPPELRNARTAYQDAATAPGANLAQTDMYEAKKYLDRAEQKFAQDGDEPATRDMAYVAERRAIIAKAKGNTALAMKQKEMALADAEAWKLQQAQAMREQLGRQKGELAKSQEQLESERRARVSAEERTADALMKLKGLTAKQEQRGLVLTLSGSVGFASGKSDLLPTARKRLDEAIDPLKNDPRPIVILGHTDSKGSEDLNMQLSHKRAEAVRNYLIQHGIEESRLTAEGMGEAQPIADNKTAEGRANNRRVEIILQGSVTPQGRPMPGRDQQQQPKPR
jgi:outer membrane protein OmpA-like peptidoglycan-associated protein